MKEIVKRLELIKTAIAIEDEEIIELQVMKLQKLEIDTEVQRILAEIETVDYANVVVLIEQYLAKYSGVVVYEDKELEALRFELKLLEGKLQERIEMKSEYQNDILEFNTRYSLELGDTVRKVLDLRKQILAKALKGKNDTFKKLKEEYTDIKDDVQEMKKILNELEEELEELDEFDDEYDKVYQEYKDIKEELLEKEDELDEKRAEAKEAKDDLKDDPSFEEYKDAKTDYEEFNEEYEETKEREKSSFNLDEDEKKELKKAFRKASKLCHPDIVTDELKEQAEELMKELNDAYSTKNLKRVREILFSLENGTGFDVGSDKIDNKEQLRTKIAEFRESLAEIERELEGIRENEVYTLLNEIDDVDEYLQNMKVELDNEIERLGEELQEKIDSYWEEKF